MIEFTSLYGTDFFDDENAESMLMMFIDLPAEVITQGVSKIHEEFSKFFCAEYFEGTLQKKDSPVAPLHGIQKCFIIIQDLMVQIRSVLRLRRNYLSRKERMQISRTNYIKPRRSWQRNVWSAISEPGCSKFCLNLSKLWCVLNSSKFVYILSLNLSKLFQSVSILNEF